MNIFICLCLFWVVFGLFSQVFVLNYWGIYDKMSKLRLLFDNSDSISGNPIEKRYFSN
jgi:hypothetical protein